MAPIIDIVTDKWYVDYENAIGTHSMLIRTNEGATIDDVESFVAALVVSLDSVFALTTLTGLRYGSAGSNFTFPVGGSFVGDTFGSGTANVLWNASAMNFVGRSPTGRRVRLAVFGYKGGFSDFRLTSAESVPVANAVTALQAQPQVNVAIDGSSPVWSPYANIKMWDYWVKQTRQ